MDLQVTGEMGKVKLAFHVVIAKMCRTGDPTVGKLDHTWMVRNKRCPRKRNGVPPSGSHMSPYVGPQGQPAQQYRLQIGSLFSVSAALRSASTQVTHLLDGLINEEVPINCEASHHICEHKPKNRNVFIFGRSVRVLRFRRRMMTA